MKTVTFCGHRDILIREKKRISPILYDEIEELIIEGVDTFLLGGYGDFDRLCSETVKKLKEKYPPHYLDPCNSIYRPRLRQRAV